DGCTCRPEELGEPVERNPSKWEVACERESQRNGRVEVCSGDVARGIDHGRNYQSKCDCHTDVCNLTMRHGIDYDCSASGEHERERAHELGQLPSEQMGE